MTCPTLSASWTATTYSSAVAMQEGETYQPAAAVGVDSEAVASRITLTLAGGGTVTLALSAGWQVFPFAVTSFAFSNEGAGSVFNLS